MITMSPEDEALLCEALRPIEELGRKAKGAPDLHSAQKLLDAAWSACRVARQLTNDIEERTREGALRRMENA